MFSFGSQQDQVPKSSSTFGTFQPSFGIQQEGSTTGRFPTANMATAPLSAMSGPGGTVPGSIGTQMPPPMGFGGITPNTQPSFYGTLGGSRQPSSSMGNLYESSSSMIPSQGFLGRPQQPSPMTMFGTPMGSTGLSQDTSMGGPWISTTAGPIPSAPGTVLPSSGRIGVVYIYIWMHRY